MRLPVAILVFSLAMSVSACGGSSPIPDGSSEGTSSSGSGERIDLDGSSALIWGDGEHGALLAHGAAFDAASWQEQAERIVAKGFTVLALEDIGSDGLVAGDTYLREQRSVQDVAFVGASAGADSMLSLLVEKPELANQLILLSPNRVVEGLGSQPKLFIASEDEPVADVSSKLAATASGEQNEAKIVPGSAHAQNLFDSDQADVVVGAILERLESTT